MESLGGSLPPGQPVVVVAGNRTHVFAIGVGGVMQHWDSTDGGLWAAQDPLPGGPLAQSVPCAIVLPDDSIHVFAIGAGSFVGGGALAIWSSTNGVDWTFALDQWASLSGGWNGVAAATPGGERIEVFAVTTAGIVQYSFDGSAALSQNPFLPNSSGMPERVLAAVSAQPGELDVFAVHPQRGVPIQWHFNGGWSNQSIEVPGLHSNSGIAAVATGAGKVQIFGIGSNHTIWSCLGSGTTFTADAIPLGGVPLPEGIPAVAARAGKLDLFAIGQGGPLDGGPLVHWRFDAFNGTWSEPESYPGGLAAGGVGAVHTQFGLDAFGFQSGGTNVLLHWPPGIATEPHAPWQNWAGNQTMNPVEGHVSPTCLEELVAIVRTATINRKRARAVGSSWSFSDVAATPGWVIETNKLGRVLTNVLPQAGLTPATTPPGFEPAPDPTLLVHVEAGIQLEALMQFLDIPPERSPKTMGGASGQTLAGVISTSVHGSHFNQGPVPDAVRAIHLVGPDGTQYWLEPLGRPITDDALLREALGPDVHVVRDDDWFSAALVTVGSFGVVYAVVLEVLPAYKIREVRTQNVWSSVRQDLSTGALFSGVEGLEVAIDPGSIARDADPTCFVATRVSTSMATPTTASGTSFDALGAYCECDSLLELLLRAAASTGQLVNAIASVALGAAAIPAVAAVVTITPAAPIALAAAATAATAAVTAAAAIAVALDLASALYGVLKAAGPGAMGDLVGFVLNRQPALTGAVDTLVTTTFQGPTGPDGVVGLAHNIMGPKNTGECATRGLGFEIAFDATGTIHLDFIDAVLAMLRDEATRGNILCGWFSVRFVGKSLAMLSPFQAQRNCTVEAVGLRTLSSTALLLGRIESMGRDFMGIQHWGMAGDLRLEDVARAYPRLNDWRRVRWMLTNGGTVHTFDNAFTLRCGLSNPPIAVSIVTIDFDPPGRDVDGEYVELRNVGPTPVAMADWTLRDQAAHVFVFPAFILESGSSVRIWTKAGINDVANLFWSRRSAVWNNPGDTAFLRDRSGTEIARYAYRTGG